MNNNIYNNNLKNEIISKADIVSIISSYVKLEKKGANYIGLCPFHDDKNPSMSVSPTKRVFKCFSCNTGGDVITFVSKFKNISYRDAMREIGASLGINVVVTKKELEMQKNKKYYDIMNDASTFYSFFLNHADDAKMARNYLHERGLNDDIIKRFNIGLSSDNDEIYKLLLSKNYLPLDMMQVGLVTSFGSNYKDYFRNRIIFPITDLDGNICGFSGRRYLVGDESSKYMNTSETIIFKKGQILYNYHDAIPKIKQENRVFLFEGFMDVIAACRASVENSIASMGTALTFDQINAFKRLTKNVTVCYDSDEAGINATLRAIEMLAKSEMEINCVTIPDGKDSDEFIKKNGEKALNDYLLNHQVSAMDFVYDLYLKNTNLNDLASAENFKNIVFKYLNLFNSNLIQERFLNKLKDQLNISYDALFDDYQLFKSNHQVDKQVPLKNQNYNQNDNFNIEEFPSFDPYENQDQQLYKQQSNIASYEKKAYIKSERKLIYAAYMDKVNCLEIDSKLKYAYVLDENRNILYKMLEYYQSREKIIEEEFNKLLTEEELLTLKDILKKEKSFDFDYIEDCIKKVKDYPIFKGIEAEKNNGQKRSLEDLDDLITKKKKITIKKTKRS